MDLDSNRQASLKRYRAELQRRVAAQLWLATVVLIACTACGSLLEFVRFPERRLWLLAMDASVGIIATCTLTLTRAYPKRSVGIGIAAVNLLGLVLGAYHAGVGAPIAVCIWTLTALLCVSALFFGWGWRPQLLASLGAFGGYALASFGAEPVILSWLTGGIYLGWVVGLSVVGAELIDHYLRAQSHLVSQLTERESRLQSYFDLSLVGTAVLSRDKIVLEVNNELCRILGYPLSELLTSTWSAFVPTAEQAVDQTLFSDLLSGQRSAVWREGSLLRRDGEVIRASISVRALPGPLGQADHLIVVVQDVTEQRRAEQEREEALLREQNARREAEAANRAKDEFLAVVSHELRTPLTTIFGWTPLLRDGHLNPFDQRRALDSIERSARSLNQLIDDLLDVARIVSGKLRLATRSAELGPVLKAAVESMRLAAEAKRVHLELHLPTQPEHVLGDPDRLQQVVWNLVSNAIKFTPADGRVEVSLTREGSELVIRVHDDGRGIAAELLPHVFERFWQEDASTTRRHGGLGLGLAIVRHLVELHGGTVGVESTPGNTVFTVRLPADPAALAKADAPVLAGRPFDRALTGVRVLVVDDETDAQEVARRALELYGVEVRTAANTKQALAILDAWAPTVLVSDIAMPDEDGYSLIRRVRLRESQRGGRLPAVAFTAQARAEDRSRALAAGFDEYVTKPVDLSQLVDAVAMAAKSGRPRDFSDSKDSR